MHQAIAAAIATGDVVLIEGAFLLQDALSAMRCQGPRLPANDAEHLDAEFFANQALTLMRHALDIAEAGIFLHTAAGILLGTWRGRWHERPARFMAERRTEMLLGGAVSRRKGGAWHGS
jgi:hypothetical protein